MPFPTHTTRKEAKMVQSKLSGLSPLSLSCLFYCAYMNVWIRSVKFLELLLSKVCKIAIIFQRMFLRLLPFSLLCIYIFVHVFDHVHSTYVMSACLSLGLSVCIYVTHEWETKHRETCVITYKAHMLEHTKEKRVCVP